MQTSDMLLDVGEDYVLALLSDSEVTQKAQSKTPATVK